MCEDGSAATLCIAQVYFGPTVPAYVWDGLRVTTARGNRVSLLTEVSRAPADVDVALHPIDRYSGGEKLRAFRSRYVRMGRQEPYEQRCGERWFALLSFLRAFGEPAALYLDSDVVMLTSAASVLPAVQTPDCDSALCLQPSNPGMAYETVDWTVSPHNALVSVRVLEDTESVPLMPRPTVETWLLHGDLAAWREYVPLSDDFADLEERVLWLEAHADRAVEIARAGRAFLERALGDRAREAVVAGEVVRRTVERLHGS